MLAGPRSKSLKKVKVFVAVSKATLLSAIPGGSIVYVKDGIHFQSFVTIPGTKESALSVMVYICSGRSGARMLVALKQRSLCAVALVASSAKAVKRLRNLLLLKTGRIITI